MENKISLLNNEGEKLVGIESIPSNKQKTYPTILLVHGFGVTKEEGGMFDDLAQAFADEGFASYRFDFSGRGESEGDYSKTTLTKLISDLKLIVEFVKQQKIVDPNKVAICAQSFGTSVTVALNPDVKTIILMGSLANPGKYLGVPSKWEPFDKEGISTRTKSSGEVINIDKQFWPDFENYDLLKLVKKITCPILFIHGSKDIHVPISEMKDYFKSANQPKVKVIIKGATHGIDNHREDLHDIASDWFKKHLI